MPTNKETDAILESTIFQGSPNKFPIKAIIPETQRYLALSDAEMDELEEHMRETGLGLSALNEPETLIDKLSATKIVYALAESFVALRAQEQKAQS